MMRISNRVGLVLALLIGGSGAVQADEPFRIVPGVVLEIYAVGLPSFRNRVEVNAAGEAAFPLLDPESVVGLTLTELRERLQSRITGRVFRQWGADGQPQLVNILPEEIVVDVAEYPPVYVSGDVSRQGEIAFRPGMTVRQVITQAGGVARGRSDGAWSRSEVADLQGSREETLVDLAAAQAHRSVLAALIEGKPMPETPRIDVALNPQIARRIGQIELERMRAAESASAETQTRLTEQRTAIEQQLSVLRAERKQMAERLIRQQQQLDEIAERRASGLVTPTRYLEEQRQLEFVQDRSSTLDARVFELQGRFDATKGELAEAVSQHRIAMLEDQQETEIRVASLTVRQRALEERLSALGASVGLASEADRPKVSIHRADMAEPLNADENSRVQAGDVIDISLPASGLLNGL